MCNARLSIGKAPTPAYLVLACLLLAGCRHTVWVDIDPSGCNAASVAEMNKDLETVRRLGAICAMEGKAPAGDRLRCHDHTLQIDCQG